MSRKPGLGDFQAYRSCLRITPAHSNLDVLHGHGAKGGAYARLAARALNASGQPRQSLLHAAWRQLEFQTRHGRSQRIFMRVERALERYTAGLIFESAYAARVYSERVSTPAVAQRVIPNGLQPDDFDTCQRTCERRRTFCSSANCGPSRVSSSDRRARRH